MTWMIFRRARTAGLASLLLSLLSLLSTGAAAQSVGQPFCHGDGCPCGNESAASGCGNDGLDGDVATGARLDGSGSSIVAQDDLTLTATGLAGGAPMLLFMGSPALPAAQGDGLICVGPGGSGVYRFAVAVADASGTASRTGLVAESQSFPGGAITVGSTWAFQAVYRDVGGPCGNALNYTNGWLVTFTAAPSASPERAELVGVSLADAPWFERVDTINEGDDFEISLDGTSLSSAAGTTVDAYVVAARSAAEWAADASLVDVRGASTPVTVAAGGAQANRFVLDAGTLAGTSGTDLGIAYDVVLDVDRDGVLGTADLIDGLSDESAVVVARDIVAPGPYAVAEFLYSGGSFLRKKVYHPDPIDQLGELPLVVISHGNGHDYRWYDYLGTHLASYGYVVMSHQNNTGPGIEAASLTTFQNVEHFLGDLSLFGGGVLVGHVDRRRMAWVGHSRGGEGIARAYKRILDGELVPTAFAPSDVRVLSSMAPTVFLGINRSNPKGVPYHLWVGSADNDVTGGTGSGAAVRSFVLHERAEGPRHVTVVQGAGHGVFHDPGHGGRVASGPCQLTFAQNNSIVRGHLVALFAHYLRGEPGALDFLTRPWSSLAPIGRPTTACAVVHHEYRDGPLAANVVLDDFQSEFDTAVSSSGEAVRSDLPLLAEDRLADANSALTDDAADPFNGMTRVRANLDTSRGASLEWTEPSFLEFDVPAAEQDLSDDAFLSFRACQRTRHPSTIAVLEDLVFEVSLIDAVGTTSTLSLDALRAGIPEPYQRSGDGVGVGWSNEFETVRIRLRDFAADGNAIDLTQIRTVRFDFGRTTVALEGAIGLDDLQITRR
ncbi:MAG: hypothetical protein AAGI22_29600 [Planctomycetota bacterium]